MKIKKIKEFKNKIIKQQALKLHLKKNQINNPENFFKVQTSLNKISNIVYKYDAANKKILFLGFPTTFKTVLKHTRHLLIPEFILFNGILSNRMSLNKTSKVKKYSLSAIKLLLKIKKIDLIIIYNQVNKSTVFKESFNARIPTVIFGKDLNFNNKTVYKSLGNYELFNEKVENNNFILSFLKTILIRSKKNKEFLNKIKK